MNHSNQLLYLSKDHGNVSICGLLGRSAVPWGYQDLELLSIVGQSCKTKPLNLWGSGSTLGNQCQNSIKLQDTQLVSKNWRLLENDIHFPPIGEIRLLLLHLKPTKKAPLDSRVQTGMMRLFRRLFIVLPGVQRAKTVLDEKQTQWKDNMSPNKVEDH